MTVIIIFPNDMERHRHVVIIIITIINVVNIFIVIAILTVNITDVIFELLLPLQLLLQAPLLIAIYNFNAVALVIVAIIVTLIPIVASLPL